MPALLTGLLGVVGSTVVHMLAALMTEGFMKKLIIKLLEKLVAHTQTDADDKILADMKKEWEK